MSLSGRKVAVVGLGYVGLPLAALCAKKGYQVVGLDANQETVASLAKGKCHIRDDAVETLLADAIASNNFQVTSDSESIADCSIYLICVPTPVDASNEPDLKPLESACRVVAPHLEQHELVVVESTVFPGTCEQVVAPFLEDISGLNARTDFFLAHCPERVNPGDLFWTSENIPRVVGATSEPGVQMAAEFYASILGGKIFDVRDIKKSLSPKFSETPGVVRAPAPKLGEHTDEILNLLERAEEDWSSLREAGIV